jgi:hypothetical protein
MEMFVVIETKSNRYYNGRAADWEGNLTSDINCAFEYDTDNDARYVADKFNKFTSIHGLIFTIGVVDNPQSNV